MGDIRTAYEHRKRCSECPRTGYGVPAIFEIDSCENPGCVYHAIIMGPRLHKQI